MPTFRPHCFSKADEPCLRPWPPILFLAALAAWLYFQRGVPIVDLLSALALGSCLFLALSRRRPPENQSRDKTLSPIARDREKKLLETIREQDIRIKEVHHRIKNHFQVISSLLSLQAGHIQDEEAREAIKRSQDWIRSMALVHEKLYGTDQSESIDLDDYIRSLSSYLIQTGDINGSRIDLDISTEPITLNMKTAVPCGLILNELITNALKYAFPDGRSGTMTIRCIQNPDGRFEMTVTDNGIGIPEEIDLINPPTMGLQLVSMLAEQLEGSVELTRKPGTLFRITFREQPEKEN